MEETNTSYSYFLFSAQYNKLNIGEHKSLSLSLLFVDLAPNVNNSDVQVTRMK